MTDLREKKRAAVDAQRRAQAAVAAKRLADRRRYHRCYWTWPWGHVWTTRPDAEGMGTHRACEVCGVRRPANHEQSVGG
jgi:hypothetical protein